MSFDPHEARLLRANARSIPALAFLLQRPTAAKGNIPTAWKATKMASTKLLEAITYSPEERKEKDYSLALVGWKKRADSWTTFYDPSSGEETVRLFSLNMEEVCSHDKNLPKLLERFQHIVGFTMILIALNLADWHTFKFNSDYSDIYPILAEDINLYIDCLDRAFTKIKENHFKGVLLPKESVFRLAERTIALATFYMSDFYNSLPGLPEFSDSPTSLKIDAEWFSFSRAPQSSFSNILDSINLDGTIDDNASNKNKNRNNRNGWLYDNHRYILSVARGLQILFTALLKTTESMTSEKAADDLRDVLASSHREDSIWNTLELNDRFH